MDALDNVNEEDREGLVLTPGELVNLFLEGWQNERLSPELLPHLGEYVECMIEQVSQMEENIKHLNKTDMRRSIHKFELQRIQFLINNYLRTRIDKIEMNALSILLQENKRSEENKYLYSNEHKFAMEYLQHGNKLFSTLLHNMPKKIKPLKIKQATIKPDLETHIFIKVKKETTVSVPDEEDNNRIYEIKLEENSQHILPYKCVQNHLKNGDVKLI